MIDFPYALIVSSHGYIQNWTIQITSQGQARHTIHIMVELSKKRVAHCIDLHSEYKTSIVA